MSHLTDPEIVDLLEGRLDAGRRRHVEGCASCRRQVELLAGALRTVRDDEIPEPSPLFWDHLSGRVAAAIRSESLPVRGVAGAWQPGWRLAAAAVVVALVGGLAWQAFLAPDRRDGPLTRTEERATADPDADADVVLDAWDALEAAAGDLEWEEAQSIGIAYRPGSAEPLVGELTAVERAELARLIEVELKRHGA
jgi:hypothetical protein